MLRAHGVWTVTPFDAALSATLRRPAGAAAGALRLGAAVCAACHPVRRHRRHTPADRGRPQPGCPAGAALGRAGRDRRLGPGVRHRRSGPCGDDRGRRARPWPSSPAATRSPDRAPIAAWCRRSSTRGGAVISEVPPLVSPEKGSFPRRNRLIAALADATIVVEAPVRSGALNTAHHALEQGRPLFVAPGRPGDPSVAGCLRLLRETPAIPLVDDQALVQELLEIFAAQEPATLARPTRRYAAAIGPRPHAGRAGAGRTPRGDRRRGAAGHARRPRRRHRIDARSLAGAISLLHLRGLVRLHGASVLPSGSLLDGRT